MMNRHPVFYCFPNLKYLESQAIVWYKVWTCITHFHFGHFTDEKDIKRTIDEAIETISKYIISYGGRFINELVNTGEFTGLEKKKIKSEMIWWSSGSDSVFSMQGARVPSLVRELDPTCCN